MTAKKIYEIGEIPQMGEVPEEMYAWVIREDRLGVPEKAMQIEKMPVQKPGKDEVLVMVMAVGSGNRRAFTRSVFFMVFFTLDVDVGPWRPFLR